MTRRRDAQELLGVPFVPPPSATRAVNGLRRALGRIRRAPVPGSIQVLEGLWGLFDNRVLGLLVELDVPDRLDRPRTTEELAAEVGA
ncbi:MAG: hypothetical protein M3394_09650, partial [Actinomycetota bacterium]|nr:hypothetical protein [Actinomycetota bacterium]